MKQGVKALISWGTLYVNTIKADVKALVAEVLAMDAADVTGEWLESV